MTAPNRDTQGRRFLRIEDVMHETCLSRATVYRTAALERVKVGTRTLITVESYERWIASLHKNAA
ncbi:AlpA family phage regulatory protein [Acetobacter sacchari]|uniref:AlpA family phage regulatory protein n=1 Tax=Acetobacter sacchari TaxID=2661687 RepID=A0ABS3M1K5_9PROT|nr:AlpA family phage regulatory protein [Acetobacter sacchari]MBO1361985.1 AlpA family phage regulatory protein [Acetobacter sacchari]